MISTVISSIVVGAAAIEHFEFLVIRP